MYATKRYCDTGIVPLFYVTEALLLQNDSVKLAKVLVRAIHTGYNTLNYQPS